MAYSSDPVHAIPAATRLRKSRGRWRLVTFIALLIAIIAIAGRFAAERGTDEAHIARVSILGTITTDGARLDVINNLAENDNVSAVIVSINSPGGTTAGGEELYESLLRLSSEKPVVAVVNELGASAAYMTAIGTDRIFARRLSIVGSIGVLYQHINAGKLLDTVGLDFDKVQTGPLKAEPDFDEPLDGAPRRSLQALVDDSFEWFVDIVAERRGLSRERTLELADGRIMTGRMGLESQLIDELGGEAEAVAWLNDNRDVDGDLPIYDYYPFPEGRFDWLTEMAGSAASSVLGEIGENAIPLDGLVSLWQAATIN